MKTVLTAALILSLLGGAAASAQPYGHDNRDDHRGAAMRHDDRRDNDRRDHDRYGGGRHDNGHHWARGQRLPANYRTREHYIDYRQHHLRAPPRGYRWVQVDNNYVMVAAATGLIASIIANGN